MTLEDRLMADLRDAMRAKDTRRKDAIRMARAAVKNAEIDLHRAATDQEIENIIRQEVRRRAEAVELLMKAGRPELVAEEKAGIAILEAYLPTLLTDQQIQPIVDRVLAEIQATSMSDMGRAMKAVMAELGNRADGRLVSELVRNRLS